MRSDESDGENFELPRLSTIGNRATNDCYSNGAATAHTTGCESVGSTVAQVEPATLEAADENGSAELRTYEMYSSKASLDKQCGPWESEVIAAPNRLETGRNHTENSVPLLADPTTMHHDAGQTCSLVAPATETTEAHLQARHGKGILNLSGAELAVEQRVSVENPPTEKSLITINCHSYAKRELLGCGGSSKVYKVVNGDGRVFALKEVQLGPYDTDTVAGFRGEIDLLHRLKGEERIVSLLEHEMKQHTLFLVMEKGEIDLRNVLLARKRCSLDMSFVRYYAREVLECVKAVHKHGIVHSDLKPANFLLVQGKLKLIDFGISNIIPEYTGNIHRSTPMGTMSYIAPESLLEHASCVSTSGVEYKSGKASDIWSCGCIIYEMVYGSPPFKSYGKEQIRAIQDPYVQIKYAKTCPAGQYIPRSVLELLRGCLVRDPAGRHTMESLLNSVFLRPRSVDHQFISDLMSKAYAFGLSRKTPLSPHRLQELTSEVWEKVVRLNDGPTGDS